MTLKSRVDQVIQLSVMSAVLSDLGRHGDASFLREQTIPAFLDRGVRAQLKKKRADLTGIEIGALEAAKAI